MRQDAQCPEARVALGNAPVRAETVDEEAGTRTVAFEYQATHTRPVPSAPMAGRPGR